MVRLGLLRDCGRVEGMQGSTHTPLKHFTFLVL